MTSAIGVSVGLGSLGVALLSTFLTLIILALAGPLEVSAAKKRAAEAKNRDVQIITPGSE